MLRNGTVVSTITTSRVRAGLAHQAMRGVNAARAPAAAIPSARAASLPTRSDATIAAVVAPRRGLVVALVAATACARARAPVEPVKPAPSFVASTASAASTPALAGPGASAAASGPAEATAVSYGREGLEGSCNGIDDDKDGFADGLLPIRPNAGDTS